MIRPRWHKVLADLWSNKARSLMIVASITVGLFAIGIITILHTVLGSDMRNGYAAIHPANIRMASEGIDQDLVDRIRHIEGVNDAEGVRTASLRLKTNSEEWIAIQINALGDIKHQSIDQVHLDQGKWPPLDREVVLERNKQADAHANIGDEIEIELLSGKVRKLKVVGIVQDQTVGANGIGGGFFLAPVQGYITTDTLEWLGLPNTFNQIYATVSWDSNDLNHIQQVAMGIRREVENSGLKVVNTIMRRSIDHPLSPYVDAIAGVLLFLGLLVVFLSGFLITNTLSTLLNQQVEQIGIMKTVGGRQIQIITLYMSLIFVFGLLAFVIAVPLADSAAYDLQNFLATRINFVPRNHGFIPQVIILQAIVALIVPQVAAFIPIWHGSQISVQEALSGIGQPKSINKIKNIKSKKSLFSRLYRPLLISLRNTFRRKGRLVLTLITLGMGGAIFISTFNVRASIETYIAQVGKYFRADVNLTMSQPYRIDRIQQELLDLPAVGRVEGWAAARSELILENGKAGDSIQLFAPPLNTLLVEPKLLAGRWLLPQDQNAITLSERFQSQFPNLKPGDTLRLRVNGKETDFMVAGIFQLAGKSGGFLAYTSYDYLSNLIHQPYKASYFQIVASNPNLTMDEQKALGREVESHLRSAGYHITDITSGLNISSSAAKGLNILIIFLLIMAGLTALVGSIGLMGTMSLNVMERTREIGIMRSIGASDWILMQMVIVEGLLIGAISWVLSSFLSIPFGKLMADRVSQAIFDASSTYTFSSTGFLLWIIAVLILSILASVIPARNAARMTIREVLAYE